MSLIREVFATITGFCVLIVIMLATFGAWVQHFITTVNHELWVLLVLGALVPPVGMLHGWLIWLGVV